MKRFFKFVVVLGLMVGMSAGLYANGLNLNSNGSKAVAMGGAFIGLADDFSAVFWNPAGLSQMNETQVSLFVSDVMPKGEYKFDLAGVSTETTRDNYLTGGFGIFKPLSDKLVLGLYVYNPSGIGSEWDNTTLANLTGGTKYYWQSYFHIITVSSAVSYKITDSLALGLAINFNIGKLELNKPGLGQYSEEINGFAVGATMGLLFKPNDMISVGLSGRIPVKAKLTGDATMSGASIYGMPTTDEATRETTLPLWLGAGIAVKPIDGLTITADVQYTNWGKMDSIPVQYTNAGWIAFFEADGAIQQDWKDAVMLRFGVEYKITPGFALRAGYYYDPSPGPVETQNILLPEMTYNWFTAGIGYSSSRFNVDLGVEYGIGKDVDVPLGLADGMPGVHSMKLLVPNISITVKL